MDFKIMTFNLWCQGPKPERAEKVFAAIRKYCPDLLGVQEATPAWMNLLRTAFPAYTAVGIGREGGDKGEYNAVFVKNDRFEVLDSGTKWLTDTPDTFSYVEGCLCPRIYTYVKLRDRTDGTVQYHINTHLDHGPEEVRMIQAKYLSAFASALDGPVTITGDFNYEETTSEVYQFFTSGVFADTKYLAEHAHQAPTFHGFENLPSIIDYCYAKRDAYTVKDYRVIDELFDGEHPSDHNPVVITLSVRV